MFSSPQKFVFISTNNRGHKGVRVRMARTKRWDFSSTCRRTRSSKFNSKDEKSHNGRIAMVSEIKILTARTDLFRNPRNEVVEVSAIERPQPPPKPSQLTKQSCPPSLIDDAFLAFNPHRDVEWTCRYERQNQDDKGWSELLSLAPDPTCRHFGSRRKIVWRPLSLLEEGRALTTEL